MDRINIGHFWIGEEDPLAVIAGPCVIEGESETLFAAEALVKIFAKHDVNFIFKSSYDKANRMSIDSYRGPGLEKGLQILQRVQQEFGVPVDTDVHSPEEAIAAGEVCEMIQVPAFLCRQTDLLVAAGNTGRVINLKKGQFMAPWDMGTAVEKIRSTGNRQIILVERGASFGYNNLVTDPRSIPLMQQFGCPVCFDASHSVQLPGGLGKQTGGQSQFIPMLAKVAITAGCQCLFIESHPHPKTAKSDAQSQLDFDTLDKLLGELKELYALIQHQRRASLVAI